MSAPIVDSHLHLWDPGRFVYPWLESAARLDRPFGIADFDRARGAVQVERAVFVECDCHPSQRLAEARWVAELARGEARIGAIVAGSAIERGRESRADLELLREIPLVKGVRRILQDEPDLGFCLGGAFLEGLGQLEELDLSFDVCVYHYQLATVVAFARAAPYVRFVLDHMGKPRVAEALLDPWREHLRQLAALPNVWCKISGLVTEANHEAWTGSDLRPYLDHALECFGIERVMFGGDWPVATLATDYPRWVASLRATLPLSAEEDGRLFRDNALEFYRIEGSR